MTPFGSIRALTFDVFGTTVDWCGGIAREAEALLAPKGHRLDWTAFANRWRQEYEPAMAPIRDGQRSYVVLDELHREMLEPTLEEFGVTSLTEAEKYDLSLGWRRLESWPDVRSGLTRLKQRYVVAALSNANLALTDSMARYAGIDWDVVLGAELAQTYKPRPEVYDRGVDMLGVLQSEVMMVACHVWDLTAAKQRGMRTAFVHRPHEFGRGVAGPMPDPGTFDLEVHSFDELASALDD